MGGNWDFNSSNPMPEMKAMTNNSYPVMVVARGNVNVNGSLNFVPFLSDVMLYDCLTMFYVA